MPDYTVSGVVKVSGGQATGVAGVAITAGQTLRGVDSSLQLAQNDSAENANVKGIALNDAAIGQPVTYAGPGSIVKIGAGAVGDIVVQSATAGGMAPSSDLVSTNFVSILGVITAANEITFNPNISGVAKA